MEPFFFLPDPAIYIGLGSRFPPPPTPLSPRADCESRSEGQAIGHTRQRGKTISAQVPRHYGTAQRCRARAQHSNSRLLHTMLRSEAGRKCVESRDGPCSEEQGQLTMHAAPPTLEGASERRGCWVGGEQWELTECSQVLLSAKPAGGRRKRMRRERKGWRACSSSIEQRRAGR